MVVRQGSKFLKPKSNVSSTDAVQAKAKLPPNEKRKIIAKFFQEFLKARRWVRQSPFWFETKTPGPKTTLPSREHFVRLTRISLTKRSMEFETGRAGGALRRAKQSGVWQPVQSRPKFCKPLIRRSRSSVTSLRFTN